MTKEELAALLTELMKSLYPYSDKFAHREMEAMATLVAEALEKYVDARIKASRQ